MIFRPDRSTIVVVGHWNRMIFSPNVVVVNIFGGAEDDQIETLVSIDPSAPIIYRKNNLQLQITEERVIISPRDFEDQSFIDAEELACNILNFLPQTLQLVLILLLPKLILLRTYWNYLLLEMKLI